MDLSNGQECAGGKIIFRLLFQTLIPEFDYALFDKCSGSKKVLKAQKVLMSCLKVEKRKSP